MGVFGANKRRAEGDSVPPIRINKKWGGAELAGSGLAEIVFMAKRNSARSGLIVLKNRVRANRAG